MFGATHFDNLLILLFFGIAVLFQFLTAAAASKKRKRPGETPPRSTSPPETSPEIENEDAQTDEDRIRKFLEALGQPPMSKPPPPARPRPTYKRPDVLPPFGHPYGSSLPPLTTRPPDLPEEITKPAQIAPQPHRRTFKPKAAQPRSFEVDPVPRPIVEAEVKPPFQPAAAPESAKPIEIATLLRSTSGLREAMILREIFGPPRSMQPLDLVGSF